MALPSKQLRVIAGICSSTMCALHQASKSPTYEKLCSFIQVPEACPNTWALEHQPKYSQKATCDEGPAASGLTEKVRKFAWHALQILAKDALMPELINQLSVCSTM